MAILLATGGVMVKGTMPALAACAPDPAANDAFVVCSGLDADGFQTTSTGVTVTVNAGATVQNESQFVPAIYFTGVNGTLINNGTLESAVRGTVVIAVAGANVTNNNLISNVLTPGPFVSGAQVAGNFTNAVGGTLAVAGSEYVVGVRVFDGGLAANFGTIDLTAKVNSQAMIASGNGSRAVNELGGRILVTGVDPGSDSGGIEAMTANLEGTSIINRGSIDMSGVAGNGRLFGMSALEGTAENSSSGTITIDGANGAYGMGMTLYFTSGVNAGLITGSGVFIGINTSSGSSVTNSGTISLSADRALGIFFVARGANQTLNNSGLIETTGAGAADFDIAGSPAVMIQSTDTVVTNTGTLRASGLTSSAVAIGYNGSSQILVDNDTPLPYDNNAIDNLGSGIIEGAVDGILLVGAGARVATAPPTLTISNAGMIRGFGAGMGTGIRAQDGVLMVENSGTITGTLDGIASFATPPLNPETGIINNLASGIISSTGVSGAAIRVVGNAIRVTNSGTIDGSAAGHAILFDPAFASTLEVLPGSTILGDVDAGAGGNSAFILGGATGSETFNVAAIGAAAQYRNFDRFYKDGGSTWTLIGSNDAAAPRPWVYRGGTLLVNASMPGTGFTNLENAATLGGTGTVGYIEALNRGTVAPGNSIGTLTATGNVLFSAGSIFAVEIAGDGTSDLLAAGGTATLSGGTVSVTALDPSTSYQMGQTYTILTAAGGVSGQFAQAVSQSAFIDPTLIYDDPNTVVLRINVVANPNPNRPGVFTTVAQTFNQFQSATGLDGLEQVAGSDALAVYNQILQLDAEAARRSLDLSSGEIHASAQQVIDQTFALFSRTLRQQGAAGRGGGTSGEQVLSALAVSPGPGVVAIDDAAAPARATRAWLAPLSGRGTINSDGNAAALDWWNAGLAGGYESAIDVALGEAYAGFGLGYIRGQEVVDARRSTLDSGGIHIGAYGGWSDGPWSLAGSLAYAANAISTERRIVFGGIDRTATADYWSQTVGFSGEALYGFDLGGGTTLSPLFTLDIGGSGHGGFTETGSGALNLTGAPQSWTRFDIGLGIALQHVVLTENGEVTLNGRIVWEHAFADVAPSQSLAFAGSPTSFTVNGPDAGRDRLRLGAGIAFEANEQMTISANYEGVFSGGQHNHSASIGLRITTPWCRAF